MKNIDFSDVAIMLGFCVFSCGIGIKYGVPDMCIVSGSLLSIGGLFFARASMYKGRK